MKLAKSSVSILISFVLLGAVACKAPMSAEQEAALRTRITAIYTTACDETLAALDVTPSPAGWLESKVGPASDLSPFVGEWQQENSDATLSMRQDGNWLVVIKSGGEERWALGGDRAYHASSKMQVKDGFSVFVVRRCEATLGAGGEMIWQVDVAARALQGLVVAEIVQEGDVLVFKRLVAEQS